MRHVALLALLLLPLALPVASAGPLARPGGGVVFAFDDGCRSNLDAAGMLEARGWRGTFFVIAGQRAPEPVPACDVLLSPDEVRHLARRGHDVQSHALTHRDLATLPDAELRRELVDAQARLSELAGRRVAHLAYPFGSADARVKEATASVYATGRLYYTSFEAMPLDPAHPHELSAIGLRPTTTLDEARGWIDAAVARGSVLVLALHDLDTAPEPYDSTPAFVGALLDHVAARGVRVLTLAEAMGGASGVSMIPRGGNEWWVQVGLAGPDVGTVVRVDARDDGGPWVALQKKSWGDWAASFRVEPGHRVVYRATLTDGRVVETCAYAHPASTCGAAAPAPSATTAAFAASFRNARGNAWWVEVDVSATGGTLAGVDARVNGGAWVALEKRSWGSWAKGMAASGAVEFRARAADGQSVISAPYAWPPA